MFVHLFRASFCLHSWLVVLRNGRTGRNPIRMTRRYFRDFAHFRGWCTSFAAMAIELLTSFHLRSLHTFLRR